MEPQGPPQHAAGDTGRSQPGETAGSKHTHVKTALDDVPAEAAADVALQQGAESDRADGADQAAGEPAPGVSAAVGFSDDGAGEHAALQEEDGAAKAERVKAEAEALSRAEGLKREGNELFGQGKWAEAAAKYNEALDAAPASAPKERAIYFSNLAACNIKMDEFAAAVQNCTAALELEPSYAKAHMRRCEAFERLDELDHALSDAKALLAAAPGNAWASAKVAALQPKVDERTEKLKAEMLGKLKELGNTILGKFGMSTDNFKFDKDPSTGSYSIRFER
ncbi:hypothetical protein GPECTOR_144g730 [Gonium pectorale]|uniref:Uncharacterized protein n=1 Tax=Gonium pectorale TaxID=33097 RepID=A0A150FY13_GONPE|nr:hypothetical protein GPECTOR_144g730 [Gonium pectorale]|eukprot:KXZ42467.1 hypothetical protein GPECTOR_144g730 [Gonium pectorale]